MKGNRKERREKERNMNPQTRNGILPQAEKTEQETEVLIPEDSRTVKTVKLIVGLSVTVFMAWITVLLFRCREWKDGEDMIKAPSEYFGPMRVYLMIALFMTLLFFIFYKYAKKSDFHSGEKKQTAASRLFISGDGTIMILVVIMLGLMLRLVLSVNAPQCDIDTGLFKYWGRCTEEIGLFKAYQYGGASNNIDYPPLYIYVLWLMAKIAKTFKLLDTDAYTMLIKLPAILADCGICIFFYKKYCENMSKNWQFFFLAIWMFNPLAIIDSACWGQVDSILALFLLLSCYDMEQKRFWRASLYMALGVAFKPQAIILIPILFYALIKCRKFNPWWQSALAFIGTFALVTLPFSLQMGMSEVELFGKTLSLPWIFSLYMGTAGHYSYTSVNALNFWFAKGKNWVRDSESFAGLTYYKWGMIAIVAISAIIWVFYLIARDRKSLPYVMGATLLSVVVTFGPRMHERYFFPVIVLLLAAMLRDNDKLQLGLYAGTSFFGFMTVAEIMTDLLVGAKDVSYNWPRISPPRQTMAIGNVVLCLLLFVYTVVYTFKPELLEHRSLKIQKNKDK